MKEAVPWPDRTGAGGRRVELCLGGSCCGGGSFREGAMKGRTRQRVHTSKCLPALYVVCEKDFQITPGEREEEETGRRRQKVGKGAVGADGAASGQWLWERSLSSSSSDRCLGHGGTIFQKYP